MKRKPKRYNQRRDIELAIDDAQHKLSMSRKLMEEYNLEADRIRDELAKIPLDKLNRDDGRTLWHQLSRKMEECRKESGIRDRAIPRALLELERLKKTLAEFDTMPMPFLEDAGVKG